MKHINMALNTNVKAKSDFDFDLKFGRKRENRLHKLLGMRAEDKVEVKTERDWWQKTGNIAIEIECNGKPSGITSTKAEYWVQCLANGDKDYCHLIFSTKTMKRLAKKYVKNTKSVGDGNRSRVVLIPLSEIFDKKNLT